MIFQIKLCNTSRGAKNKIKFNSPWLFWKYQCKCFFFLLEEEDESEEEDTDDEGEEEFEESSAHEEDEEVKSFLI